MPRQGFRVFDGRHLLNEVKEPTLSVQKGGSLDVNLTLFKALGEPEFVEFLWDGDRTIGLKPVSATERTRSAYPVRPQENGTSYVISSVAPLRWARVPLTGKVRYYHPEIEDGVAYFTYEPDGAVNAEGEE